MAGGAGEQRQAGEQNVSRLLSAATRPEGEWIVSHLISRALVYRTQAPRSQALPLS